MLQHRKGAGRKRKKDGGIPHAKREDVPKNNPVMVTLKLRSGLPDLRRKAEFALILASFRLAQEHAKARPHPVTPAPDHRPVTTGT